MEEVLTEKQQKALEKKQKQDEERKQYLSTATEMNLTDDDIVEKPLNENKFLAFFQKIYRWWMGKWNGFQDGHPTLAAWIYKIFFFFAFSMGVTVFQFIVMTFLPAAFTGMGTEPFGWPGVAIKGLDKNGAQFIIFGDQNGLGYFVAYEIATFLAQCINLPLQRNITYKSKGNIWFQAMWYFIGWVLISVFCNTIWGFCNCILTNWGWYEVKGGFLEVVAGLLKTVLTGGVSMIIFFFIFMVVFPDLNKAAKTARAKADKLNASAPDSDKAKEANAKADEAFKKAELDNARRNLLSMSSLANGTAVSYHASLKRLEKIKADEKKNTEENIKKQEENIAKRRENALIAIVKKSNAEKLDSEVKAKYQTA